MSSTENNYQDTDLGNITFNPRGEYNSEETYEYLDTVSYMGGSYMCLAELAKTISGIAPAQGENTDYWQMLTLPGQLTPEAVAMHDDVVNKAKQVETSRAAVELSQQEVEAAQADVTQMRQDTQEASEEAIASRDSAAGYAQSAEASRTAAKESEDNINAQITGFDTHVAEKTSATESTVEEARKKAIDAITTQQDTSTKAVTDEGTTQTNRVEGTGNTAVSAVAKQQAASVQAVENAGTAQVTAIESAGDEQITEVNKAGTVQVENIEEAAKQQNVNITEAAAQELIKLQAVAKQFAEDHEQIETNKEDISNKITKFYAPNQGETHLADSDNGKIMDMMLYGKSEQKQYSGKNLFELSDNQVQSENLKIQINQGIITFFGTVNTEAFVREIDSFTVPSDGTYTISTNSNSNKDSPRILFLINDNPQYGSAFNGATKELNAGDVVRLYIRISSVGSYDGVTIKPMIEKGSKVTSYEPYTGGQPSPSPDYPQEIKSVVNPTIKLSNGDGTESQTVTLPYTLNAIPVSKDGNVTINGQQYVADYVDVEKGVLVRKINSVKLNELSFRYEKTPNNKNNTFTHILDSLQAGTPNGNALCKYAPFNTTQYDVEMRMDCRCYVWRTSLVIQFKSSVNIDSVDKFKKWLESNSDASILYVLATPQEISLAPEEIIPFKALATYYPTTNISVNSEQLDGYTVFNYPISMANGWNYVKQQIGDTREYIYDIDTRTQDIDTQAAEAYVNSEYAVALTELEV